MALPTGENEQGLRKVTDMTRLISIGILLLHIYFYCYGGFKAWGLTSPLSDTILTNIARSGLFKSFHTSKLIALGFLFLSILGVRGRKSEKLNYRTGLAYTICGLILYFASAFCLYIPSESTVVTACYAGVTGFGFLLTMTGGAVLARVIKGRMKADIFNKANESFPQEERLLINDFSFNLPAVYELKGKQRRSWVSFVNMRRGFLLMGLPGCGKSFYVIEEMIRQFLAKGMCMALFDFKYDDLTKVAYHHYLKNAHKWPVQPKFCILNFEEVQHRCNPIEPSTMRDITDAIESARAILLGLNKQWNLKQGDFWVESPINFFTAIVWFLKKYQGGDYCTIPHAIEMAQMPYDKLFSVLQTEPECRSLLSPFISAYVNGANEQLEGQIAGAKISLARLSSPQIYYVMSGSDFSLDINNPKEPKILCMASNPQKQDIFGAVLSLYIDRMNKIINKKGQWPTVTLYDEFASLVVRSYPQLCATARSNDIIPVIAIQDFGQLEALYGREQAQVIMNISGNLMVGTSNGTSAKIASERFPKILQDRESISINSADTSLSRSKQLEASIHPYTISGLSAGEFVGIVADDPDTQIELKTFHSRIINNVDQINRERAAYQPRPKFCNATRADFEKNFQKIIKDVNDIVETVMERLLNDPGMEDLVVKKN
jgi:hypothetical protein